MSAPPPVFAVLGHPVGHSRSPRLHRAWLAAAGLDGSYVALDTRSRPAGDVIAGVRALGFAGVNLTMPLKEAAVGHLDALDPSAAAIGAVNTVARRGDLLVGSNTDAEGFVRAARAHGSEPRGARAVVLGAGGAARAVVAGLVEAGAAEVVVLAREARRAARVADEIGRGLAVGASWASFADHVRGVDLVAVAVPDAARGAVASLDPSGVRPGALWMDLAYAHPDPVHAGALRARGARVVDGRAMLVHQGALAFAAFTGHAADPAVGWAALGWSPPPGVQ